MYSPMLYADTVDAKGRHFSIASTNTLTKLQQLEAQFGSMVEALNAICDSITARRDNRDVLIKAKNQLAQICGDIDKFQFEKIDSVSAGTR